MNIHVVLEAALGTILSVTNVTCKLIRSHVRSKCMSFKVASAIQIGCLELEEKVLELLSKTVGSPS